MGASWGTLWGMPGGGGGGGSNPAAPYNPYLNPSFESVNDVRRFMRQAGWGERPGEAQSIFDSGVKAGDYLEELWNAPYQPFLYSSPHAMDAGGPGDNNSSRRALSASWIAALTGTDGKPDHFTKPRPVYGMPFRTRLTDAALKIWCLGFVQTGEIGSSFTLRAQNFYMQAFDNCSIYDVIEWLTWDVGMGKFLDNSDNAGFKPAPILDIEPNQNYVRELFQLFTTGQVQLNEDGTPVLDIYGNPLPTYAYEDVFAVTRMFSGFQTTQGTNISSVMQMTGSTHHQKAAYSPWLDIGRPDWPSSPTNHVGKRGVPTPGTILGDIDRVLRKLGFWTQTYAYVAKHFISELTTENPSPDYVRYVVAALKNDGHGNAGRLKAMIRAILLHPEARGDGKPATSGRALDFIPAVAAFYRAGEQIEQVQEKRVRVLLTAGSPVMTFVGLGESTAGLSGAANLEQGYRVQAAINGGNTPFGGIPLQTYIASVDSATQVTLSQNATVSQAGSGVNVIITRSPSREAMRIMTTTSPWDAGATSGGIFGVQEPGMVPSVFSYYPFDKQIEPGFYGRATNIWDTTSVLAWFKNTFGPGTGRVTSFSGVTQDRVGTWKLDGMISGAPTNAGLIDRATEILTCGRSLPAGARTELIGMLDDLATLNASLFGAPDNDTKRKNRAAYALAGVAMMSEAMEQV